MLINFKQFISISSGVLLSLLLLLLSCDNSKRLHRKPKKENNRIAAKNVEAKIESCAKLLKLLNEQRYADYYHEIKLVDINLIRSCFEQEAKNGLIFNYGVLFNSNIITEANKYLFKPDIKNISSFKFVKNDSKCFMNAPLYAIANSEFFDDFLEIDKIYSNQWQARPLKNQGIANDILRSLREVIYEIRRGIHTTSQKITTLRDNHYDSFAYLDDQELLLSIYHELLTSYVFGDVIYAFTGDNGFLYPNLVNNNSKISPLDLDYAKLYTAMKNFQAIRKVPFGPLNALITLPGNQDLVYLDSVFSIIDPWGSIARYLSFVLYINGNEDNIIYKASYSADIALELNNIGKLRIFYDNVSRDSFGLHMRAINNSQKHSVQGKIIYKYMDALSQKYPNVDQGFRLIAKTKHSNNHQIAELFNRSRKEWETHLFYGPPTFSKMLSAAKGTFQDQLSFFEKSN